MIQDKAQQQPAITAQNIDQEAATGKRKLIKRQIPQALKKKIKLDDSTKNDEWKPQKLSELAPKTTSKQSLNAKNLSFLSSLPKPKNLQPSKPITSDFSKIRPKPRPVIDISHPNQQQLKYDIQDTTFIVKQFVDQAKKTTVQDKEQEQELVPVPQQYEGVQIKNISKGQLIDVDWQKKQKQKQMKLNIVEELKNTLGQMDKGPNQINFLLDEAIRRNQQQEFDTTKKATDFKKMKNRYGW